MKIPSFPAIYEQAQIDGNAFIVNLCHIAYQNKLTEDETLRLLVDRLVEENKRLHNNLKELHQNKPIQYNVHTSDTRKQVQEKIEKNIPIPIKKNG